MAKFFQCEAKDFGVLAVVEEGAQFGFSGRGNDAFEEIADDMDCSVEFDRLCFDGDRSEEVVACNAAAGTSFGEI